MADPYHKAYGGLNKAQKEAVDTIEGPVMVIAGPGTGKTQVLALRIAHILKQTDTPADGILCLTFTNSGVKAMRERLLSLIGPAATRVAVSTFHSFGASLLEEFYESLGLPKPPALLDERDSVLLADELLEEHEWQYLRPRSGGAHNFRDLKSLISLLKREQLTPGQFIAQIEDEISRIESDPSSISSRGARKGELKSDILQKIDRLNRTKEAASFYELYEKTKAERGLADYDDILEYSVRLVQSSSDARASIAERYLYVLVDEHQDSSGVQNRFLEAVWSKTEKPNLFVVGDDRQLIYGFGGASLSHFEGFREAFSGTKLISLEDNYRSTQSILDTAGLILESSIAKGKLKSSKQEGDPVRLVEAAYPRDEILAAGQMIKQKLENGLSPADCAVLVPKNAQVKNAIEVLKDLGLPVAAGRRVSFFSLRETQTLISLMKTLSNPADSSSLAEVILNPAFGVPILIGHNFIREHGKHLEIEKLATAKGPLGELGSMCAELMESSRRQNIYEFIQEMSKKVFFTNGGHKELILEIEAVRTMLHLALSRLEKNPKTTLGDFVRFIERLIEYGEDIPLAVFAADEGVKVMTLHASKGLEFDFVWIAHLDERSLMKGKGSGFTLPESLAEHAAKKDELTARRELYVAITRAKTSCTLSYALSSYSGGDQMLSSIIAELPEGVLARTSAAETEKDILSRDPSAYVSSVEPLREGSDVADMQSLVRDNYPGSSIAVTHLNNFFSCPWKWYFRNFLRLPEPESESLIFGDLVHKLIDRQMKEGSFRHDFRQEIESYLNELHVYDESTRRRLFKDADIVLSRFQDSVLPGISEDFATEKSLRYTDPDIGVAVTGKLDLVEQLEDGSVRVSDFKTGSAKTASAIEKLSDEGRLSDMMRQLAMYSYLMEHQRQNPRISSSRLIFLESEPKSKDFIYETEIGKEEIGLLRKDLADFHVALMSGEWALRPCDNNSYGKACEYCALKDRLLKN